MTTPHGKTVMQSTITFTHAERPKQIIYMGSIAAANVVILNLYPGHTDKQGHTTVIELTDKGQYYINDLRTGSVEHYHSDSLK